MIKYLELVSRFGFIPGKRIKLRLTSERLHVGRMALIIVAFSKQSTEKAASQLVL